MNARAEAERRLEGLGNGSDGRRADTPTSSAGSGVQARSQEAQAVFFPSNGQDPATPAASAAATAFWGSPTGMSQSPGGMGLGGFLPQGFNPVASPTPSVAGSSKFTPLKRVRKGGKGGSPANTPATGETSARKVTPQQQQQQQQQQPATPAPRKRDSLTSGTTEVASHPDPDYGIHGKKLATAYANPVTGTETNTTATPGSSPEGKQKPADLVLLHISLMIPHNRAPAFARHQRRMLARRRKAGSSSARGGFENALMASSDRVLGSEGLSGGIPTEDSGEEDDSLSLSDDSGNEDVDEDEAGEPGPLSVLSPNVYQRGILIPHPKGDYEALQREVGLVLGLPFEDLKVDEEDPVDVAAAAAKGGRNAGKWAMRVYARNGWLTRGAWERAWAEMERVDVEISEVGNGGTSSRKERKKRLKAKRALAAAAAANSSAVVVASPQTYDDAGLERGDVQEQIEAPPESPSPLSPTLLPETLATDLFSDQEDEGESVPPASKDPGSDDDKIDMEDTDIMSDVDGYTPNITSDIDDDIADIADTDEMIDDDGPAAEEHIGQQQTQIHTTPHQQTPKPGQLQLENGTVSDGVLEEAYRNAQGDEYHHQNLAGDAYDSYVSEPSYEDHDSQPYEEYDDREYESQRYSPPPQLPPRYTSGGAVRRRGTKRRFNATQDSHTHHPHPVHPMHPYQYILDLLKPIVLTGLVVSAGMFFFGPTSANYGYHPYSRSPSNGGVMPNNGRHGAWSGGVGTPGGKKGYAQYQYDDNEDGSMDQDLEFDGLGMEGGEKQEYVPEECAGYVREAELWRRWIKKGAVALGGAEGAAAEEPTEIAETVEPETASETVEVASEASSSSEPSEYPRHTPRPQHHHYQHHQGNQGSGGDWTVTVTQTVTQRIVNAGATQIVVEIPSGEAQFPLGPLGLESAGGAGPGFVVVPPVGASSRVKAVEAKETASVKVEDKKAEGEKVDELVPEKKVDEAEPKDPGADKHAKQPDLSTANNNSAETEQKTDLPDAKQAEEADEEEEDDDDDDDEDEEEENEDKGKAKVEGEGGSKWFRKFI